jgi:hypothetical protein
MKQLAKNIACNDIIAYVSDETDFHTSQQAYTSNSIYVWNKMKALIST